MRRVLVSFFRFFVRVFYRRVEVLGLERVPARTGVVFAVNHPNGLVDPLFVVCYAPRAVSFLAKAPLFRYPVLGWLVRGLDSIPIYRKQDNVAGSNAETFARAREVLARGGGIAIFPEGTTHSDPRLRELKTGAARIALGAAGGSAQERGGSPRGPAAAPARDDGVPVVVPTGIYYSAKYKFRSDALVVFGDPITVPRVPAGEDGEPPAEAVRRLTDEIERGLATVTLQADSRSALDLVAAAEDIFSAADPPKVASEFTLRRRFIDGYHFLREHDPQRLERLASEITKFGADLGDAKLEPHELVARFRPLPLIVLLVMLPLALIGAALHYPTYRLVGVLASRFAKKEDEMTATMKSLSAMLLFPLTWIVYAIAAGAWLGAEAAIATLVAAPLLAYIAMRAFERLDVTIGRLRAITRLDRFRKLTAEREAIRREILAVAEEMARPRS